MSFNSRNIYLVVLLVLLNCTENDPNIVVHPREDSIAVLTQLEHTLDFVKEKSTSPLASSFTDSVLIESEDLMENGFIANILGVEVDASENIYVGLGPESVIKVFSPTGTFINSFGGLGRGPGEFTLLRDIHIDKEKNLLFALDSNEIEIFDLSSGKIEHLKAIYTGLLNSTQMCVLDENIYVNGSFIVNSGSQENPSDITEIQASKPIHQINIETEEVASFGRVYKSTIDYGVFDSMLSNTLIACNQESKTITGVFSNYPLFVGYNAATLETKWVSGLLGVNNASYEENTMDKTLQRKALTGVVDQYGYLSSLPNKYALLQIGFELPDDFSFDQVTNFSKNRDSRIRLVLINTETGELSKLKADKYFYKYIGNKALISLKVGVNPSDGYELIYKRNPIYSFE